MGMAMHQTAYVLLVTVHLACFGKSGCIIDVIDVSCITCIHGHIGYHRVGVLVNSFFQVKPDEALKAAREAVVPLTKS